MERMAFSWNVLLEDCVDFARRLIQTPSMSFEEQAAAELVAAEMRRLGFDEVWLDDIGNACGRIYGRDRSLGTLVLNSHLDHVDPGDPKLWPVPPYSAEIVDGRILGRGACDIKGPLAVQVYSMAALLRQGVRPRRDLVFSGVVQEEIGGAGAVHWAANVDYPVALLVLGEPSRNRLSLGHRGILSMWVTFYGRSVHASVPESGHNPNYDLARFLARMQDGQAELVHHPLLGPTTVAPTLLEVDTRSPNVTPAWSRVLLDFRTATESPNSLQAFVRRLAGDRQPSLSHGWAREPDSALPDSDEPIFGFYTPPDSEVVQRVLSLLAEGMEQAPELTSYQFATDGRHFVPYNFPMVGYAPGEERLAHTVAEAISIEEMDQGLRGYVHFLREF
jgi:succinyl-diaminopimelate desuccinylase